MRKRRRVCDTRTCLVHKLSAAEKQGSDAGPLQGLHSLASRVERGGPCVRGPACNQSHVLGWVLLRVSCVSCGAAE